MIRVLHQGLTYDEMPTQEIRAQLSGAVSSVDPTYQLFWQEDSSLLSETWYEMVNDRGRGDGSPWLSRVDAPGLKCGQNPVIPAKVQVMYGPKPPYR